MEYVGQELVFALKQLVFYVSKEKLASSHDSTFSLISCQFRALSVVNLELGVF